uniref:Transposase n=1 Tax=Peronospora matthiolae TaxID=2874970 RepID=A0AAV1T364_9STRA
MQHDGCGLELNQVRDLAGALSDPCGVSSSGLLECLFAVMRHREAVDAFVAGETSMCNADVSIKEWVASLSSWAQVSTVTEELEPCREIMNLVESDSLLLSTFCHQFTQLWGHVRVDKYESLATKIRGFRHQVCQGKPRARRLRRTSSEYPKPRSKTIVDELTRFTARVGLFADDAVWESAQQCNPLHWWRGFISGSCLNLQAVALRTLGCPMTSGLSGKRRKTFEKILTMNAKYMTEEQAIKAAVVYVNANLASHVEDGTHDGTRTEKRSHRRKTACGPQQRCRFIVPLAQHLHPSARVT